MPASEPEPIYHKTGVKLIIRHEALPFQLSRLVCTVAVPWPDGSATTYEVSGDVPLARALAKLISTGIDEGTPKPVIRANVYRLLADAERAMRKN